MTRFCSFTVCALAAALSASNALAAPPLEAADRTAVIGTPAAVEAFPAKIALSGSRDAAQLVITGKYADGTVRDLTAVVSARVEPSAFAYASASASA